MAAEIDTDSTMTRLIGGRNSAIIGAKIVTPFEDKTQKPLAVDAKIVGYSRMTLK